MGVGSRGSDDARLPATRTAAPAVDEQQEAVAAAPTATIVQNQNVAIQKKKLMTEAARIGKTSQLWRKGVDALMRGLFPHLHVGAGGHVTSLLQVIMASYD